MSNNLEFFEDWWDWFTTMDPVKYASMTQESYQSMLEACRAAFEAGENSFKESTERPNKQSKLRDRFAMAALQGMAADSDCTGSWEDIAISAYASADAMLAVRGK